MIIMLIPDLLNILFDQSDYLVLVGLASLNKRKTRYATKYSVLVNYDIFDGTIIKNIGSGGIKTIKTAINTIELKYVIEYMSSEHYSSVEIIKLLVHNGINFFDLTGDVHICAINGYSDAIKFLASFEMIKHTGEILALAAHNGHLDIVKFLISIGADVCYSDNLPLLWSAISGYVDIAKFLVGHGADMFSNNYMLAYCAEHGHLEMVEYLVNEGVDAHAYNDAALRWSAEKNKLHVVKYLIGKGASISGYIFDCDKPTDTMRYLASIGANIRCNYTPYKN